MVNVILNIQPVISTIGAFMLFGDRLARQFFLYAGIAIVAGVSVPVAYSTQIGVSFERAGLNVGTGYALICALFWGTFHRRRAWCDGWHVVATCFQHANRRWARVHDLDSFGCTAS